MSTATGAQVWTMGESMMSLRASSALGPTTTWTTHVAGAESNVAIGLARLGHSVAWASRVGDDDYGRLVVRQVRGEGVDVSGVAVDPDHPTGFMLLAPGAFGAAVDYHRAGSAASVMDESMVAALEATTPEVAVLSGITPALGPRPAAATLACARRARELGALVVLDVNHRSKLWSAEQARQCLTEVLDRVDVLVGSPDEIDLLGLSVDDLLARGVGEVVVKLGAHGARTHLPARVVDGLTEPLAVVDPVGAGDAFTAGYVSGLLDGLDPADRLRRGNLMGGAAVRHSGDWEGLPFRAELLAREQSAGADVTR
ncbi:sugar kinase [Propionibacteriaceae bacterium Y1923]